LIGDSVHPSTAGYVRVAELWADAITRSEPVAAPTLHYLPSTTSSPASGVIAIQGVAAGSTVTYTFRLPDGSISFGPSALPCGPTMSATADAFGLCSFAFRDLALGPR